ncbi:MAG: thioredoxin family protein [Flavobacteriaceae bacterium]
MKYCLYLFLFVIPFSISAQEISDLDWFTNLEAAQKVAKKEKKPLLIYFTGSDWCSPCKMLKEDFFASEEFHAKAEGLVLVLIDFPRRIDIISEAQMAYNKTIIEKYNTEKSFPNLVGMSYKGKIMAHISGYSPLRDTSHHFEFIEKLLK